MEEGLPEFILGVLTLSLQAFLLIISEWLIRITACHSTYCTDFPRCSGCLGDTVVGGGAPATMVCMDSEGLTYRDYARFARQSLDEIARDCEVSVFRASGPGGQCVNTTDSAVRTKHIPTGITVTARDSRSQHRNRQSCLEKLHLTFTRRAVPPKARTKTKVPRRTKEKRLKDKRMIAQKKASRNTFE